MVSSIKKEKKVFLIVWYLPSFPGGAEKSIIEELNKYKNKGYSIKIICFDEKYKLGFFKVGDFEGINYGLKINIPFFKFYTLLFNRFYVFKKLKLFLSEIKGNLVLTQTLMAPIIADFCIRNNIKYIYYLRDELNINEFHNYEVGFRRFFKLMKTLFEFPGIVYYKSKNFLALRKAYKIISNSKFMKSLLEYKYNISSVVFYPQVDFSSLKKELLNKKKQKYITFIGGGNAMKGYDIVLKIAKSMPNEKFLIVGPYKKSFKKDNLFFVPKKKDVMRIYSQSKLVLMPSRWNEAFGRVVLEANYLGIPVITSNRGGLPEANKNKKLIIKDLENIDEWVTTIKSLIK